MIQIRHPLPIARPYSVQRSDDARARRARLLRRARVLRSVWAGIQRYEAEQDARWACAAEAWAPFLGECDDN